MSIKKATRGITLTFILASYLWQRRSERGRQAERPSQGERHNRREQHDT